MLQINPTWKQFVILEGKKQIPTIYSKAIKALYSIEDTAKLFYDILCHVLLNKLGFTTNLFDGCMANKNINNE